MYQERTYRNHISRDGLTSFQVTVKETDLWVLAEKNLENVVRELVLKYRGYIEAYIQANPQFLKTFAPWHITGPAPKIVMDMAKAGRDAGVGPMAAVAGAIAEYVGRELLSYSSEIVVENGGDIFIKINHPIVSSIYAGNPALDRRIGIRVFSMGEPMGICTSSGTIGHSFSKGKADAVCVISKSCTLADAAATAIANRVASAKTIEKAIGFGKQIPGISGVVIIAGDRFGVWGDVEVVPLTGHKDP